MPPVANMRCPICKKSVAFDDPFMPFCSDRCRIIDLVNWATEKYVIPVPKDPNDPAEDEEQPEGPNL